MTIPELGKTIEARVSSNTPLFDATSRTLKLRVEAENPRLLLRPDMFVDVEFQVKAPDGLSVPADAVLKGVAIGDRIVVAGNFLLDSESRMRATALTAAGL